MVDEGETMSRKKLVGRIGVAVIKDARYVEFNLAVKVKNGYYSRCFLKLHAQADADCPDRAYALQISGGVRFDDYEFTDTMKLANQLYAAMKKESAPRAILGSDGKPYLANCELSQLLQGAEKLGLHVSRFESWREAYDWAEKIAEEETATSDESKAVSA